LAVGVLVALMAPLVDGLTVGEPLGVGLIEGQGLADALPEADGIALGVGLPLVVAVGEALALDELEGLALGEALIETATQLACGCSNVWFPAPFVVAPPRSRSAAGTTSSPRMTVITKASAPHSWSQKAREELRIRARRPAQAEACYGY
jgi:hypothetical protein